MLAGTVKLKHFLAGVAVLGIGGAGALAFFGGALIGEVREDIANRPAPAPAPAAAPAPVATPAPAPAPAPAPEPALELGDTTRVFDAVVLSYQGKDLGTSKKKDVTKGKPYKVNVYQDDGYSTANRAKVDIDRDDQWDEKWTFDTTVTRKVAPNDDENYTEVYLFDGKNWALE